MDWQQLLNNSLAVGIIIAVGFWAWHASGWAAEHLIVPVKESVVEFFKEHTRASRVMRRRSRDTKDAVLQMRQEVRETCEQLTAFMRQAGFPRRRRRPPGPPQSPAG